MLEKYIVAVLTETVISLLKVSTHSAFLLMLSVSLQAKLQSLTKYNYKAVLSEVHGQEPFQAPLGKPLVSHQDVVKRFNEVDDHLNHTEEWSRREAQIVTAIAAFEGKPCPRTTCSKCCGNAALRASPNRIVRSPCGKTQPIATDQCPAAKTSSGLDSRDPWQRESLQSLKQQAMRPVRQQAPQSFSDMTSAGGAVSSQSAREPAWKQWLKTKSEKSVDNPSIESKHPEGALRQRYSRGNHIKPSGTWGNKVMTEMTGSDPLAGRKRVREAHD